MRQLLGYIKALFRKQQFKLIEWAHGTTFRIAIEGKFMSEIESIVTANCDGKLIEIESLVKEDYGKLSKGDSSTMCIPDIARWASSGISVSLIQYNTEKDFEHIWCCRLKEVKFVFNMNDAARARYTFEVIG